MITYNELLSGNSIQDVSIALQQNGEELLKRINKVRTDYAEPMIVTSGLRTMQQHINIYKKLAEQRKEEFDASKIPMGSAHLKFCAVDILDKDGKLFKWCKNNKKLLEDVGLWLEEQDDQPRVHFQTYAPASGNRFFKP
jgi:hypothetical protein